MVSGTGSRAVSPVLSFAPVPSPGSPSGFDCVVVFLFFILTAGLFPFFFPLPFLYLLF